MQHSVTCTACNATFAIPDDIWDRRVRGRVATLKCRTCKAEIRVDGTKGTSQAPATKRVSSAPPSPPATQTPLPQAQPTAGGAGSSQVKPTPTDKATLAGEPTPAAKSPTATATGPSPGYVSPATTSNREGVLAQAREPRVTAQKASAATGQPTTNVTSKDPLASAGSKAIAATAAAKAVTGKVEDSKLESASSSPPEELPVESLWAVSFAEDDDRELTEAQIASHLEKGDIDGETLVWREGMSEWETISKVPRLHPFLPKALPKPAPVPTVEPAQKGPTPVAPVASAAATAPAAPITPTAPAAPITPTAPAAPITPAAKMGAKQEEKKLPARTVFGLGVASLTPSQPKAVATTKVASAPNNPTPSPLSPATKQKPAPPAPLRKAPSVETEVSPPPPLPWEMDRESNELITSAPPMVRDAAAARKPAPPSPHKAPGEAPSAPTAPTPPLAPAAPTPPAAVAPALPAAIAPTPLLQQPAFPSPAANALFPPVPARAADIQPPSPSPGHVEITDDDFLAVQRRFPKWALPAILGGVGVVVLAIVLLRSSGEEEPVPQPESTAADLSNMARERNRKAKQASTPVPPLPASVQQASGASASEGDFAKLFAAAATPKGAGGFDEDAARKALSGALGKAQACKQKGDPSGTVSVSLVIAPSGQVLSATVAPPFDTAQSAKCIQENLKAARIPGFKGTAGRMTLSVPFR